MAKDQKLGVCGIACFKCPVFVKKECPGCHPNEVCPLPECAGKKGKTLCFECEEFPCEVCYEKGPFVRGLLDYFKGRKG